MVSGNEKNGPSIVEMETFLPKDGSNIKDGTYQVNPKINRAVESEYDPFRDRKVENPTSDCDTLTHLLKSALGTGILAMPMAFKNIGLIFGIFATIFVAIVCTHCAYVLVQCAHELYKRLRVPTLGYPDIGELSFANGPKWGQKFAKPARMAINIGIFLTYFGTCSVYTVIIAKNFEQIIEYHTHSGLNERVYIAALLLPLILLAWIPNLKYLAPVSMIANIFMAVGLGITMYYIVQDLPPITDRNFVGPLDEWPQFFSITIFAMEAIGVVMPLENNMKTPRHFVGICGILNQGMSGVALVYMMIGFLGYFKYGDITEGSITLNLPTEEIPAQMVKILIALAVFCTFGLQFYVCLDILWNGIKDRCEKNQLLKNYCIRTVLVIISVLIAVAVPTIGPFIGLIGAFFFSFLGLIFPVFIEMVTFWEQGFGRFYWKVWKNIIVLICGVLALIFGSTMAIMDIINLYK